MEPHGNPVSPALLSRLKLLDKSELARTIAAFEFAASHGAEEEGDLRRTSGASFNPRPARVCQLVWDSAEERRPEVLAGAALSCMPGRWPSAADREAGSTIGKAAHAALHSPSGPDAGALSPEAANVFLAHRIDELRHLHLLSPRPMLERLAALAAERPRWNGIGAHPALLTLADAAFLRLARQMEAP